MDHQTVELRIQREATSTDQRLLLEDQDWFSSRSENPQYASHRGAVQVVWSPSSTPPQIEPPLCISSSQPPRMETTTSVSPEINHKC